MVIVGYGKQEKVLKEIVNKKNFEAVKFLGAIEQYKLPKIYISCDVLVLPSTEEVWGLVVNEALYCGLKVVVSDVCGCADDLVKIGENGYVFKSANISDLTSKLQKTTNLLRNS